MSGIQTEEEKMSLTEKNIMAVGAHADDIEFNVTGTLLKYHKMGYSVTYVMSTNNCSGTWSKINEKGERVTDRVPWYVMMPQRKLEAARAARELFDTEPIHLDYAQRHYLDRNCVKTELRYGCAPLNCSGPEVPTILTACEDKNAIESFAKLILEKNPECIITHGYTSYTAEHFCTATLVREAFDLACRQGYQGSLIHWIELDSCRFGRGFIRHETFVDTTGFGSEAKRKALEIHFSQVPTAKHLDLEDEINGKECGCESAETYITRKLNRDNPGELTRELVKHFRD